MDFVYLILIGTHIVGTILGVGGATIVEFQVAKALADGQMDASERQLLHMDYFLVRIAMLILILSGIGLVWYHFFVLGNTWVLESTKVWFKDFLVIAILGNALLIQKRMIPLWLGAAISFTSWWGAAILGYWREFPYSFVETFVGYVVAVFAAALILHQLRQFVKRNEPKKS